VRVSSSGGESFEAALSAQVDAVFRAHPSLHDHRRDYPWVTGALGDPREPVWFLMEYPSVVQVEKLPHATPESQWSVSRGDRVLREMLAKHGFKAGERWAPGGWRCYITNVVKSVQRPARWNAGEWEDWFRVAEAWAPVLAWQFEHGRPRVLAVQGRRTRRVLDHLISHRLVEPPARVITMWASAYVASRPDAARGLGPMHPRRLAEHDEQFAAVARAAGQGTREFGARRP
jgi:hypothetical protein